MAFNQYDALNTFFYKAACHLKLHTRTFLKFIKTHLQLHLTVLPSSQGLPASPPQNGLAA